MLFANLPLSRQIKSAREHILADLRKGINLFVPPFPPDRGRPFRSVSVFTIPPSILFDLNNFPPGRGRPFRPVSGTTFLPLSLVWSSVFLCPFLVPLPTYGPAAGDRSKVIAPCSALHGQRSRAGWASLSSWPIGLVRRVGHYLPLRPLSRPVFADGGWLSGQPQRSHHASHHASHHSPSSI